MHSSQIRTECSGSPGVRQEMKEAERQTPNTLFALRLVLPVSAGG